MTLTYQTNYHKNQLHNTLAEHYAHSPDIIPPFPSFYTNHNFVLQLTLILIISHAA